MKNLSLIDKLVAITDMAKSKCMDTWNAEMEEILSLYEEELIEYLQSSTSDNI